MQEGAGGKFCALSRLRFRYVCVHLRSGRSLSSAPAIAVRCQRLYRSVPQSVSSVALFPPLSRFPLFMHPPARRGAINRSSEMSSGVTWMTSPFIIRITLYAILPALFALTDITSSFCQAPTLASTSSHKPTMSSLRCSSCVYSSHQELASPNASSLREMCCMLVQAHTQSS